MTVTTCRAQLGDALEGCLVPNPSLTLSLLPGSSSPSYPLLHDNLPELMHVVNAARQPWTDFSEVMSWNKVFPILNYISQVFCDRDKGVTLSCSCPWSNRAQAGEWGERAPASVERQNGQRILHKCAVQWRAVLPEGGQSTHTKHVFLWVAYSTPASPSFQQVWCTSATQTLQPLSSQMRLVGTTRENSNLICLPSGCRKNLLPTESLLHIKILFSPSNIHKINKIKYMYKNIYSGLERWLRSSEHLLLLQGTLAQSLAPTWWLINTCNCSSGGSDALFWPPQDQAHMWCIDIQLRKKFICIK